MKAIGKDKFEIPSLLVKHEQLEEEIMHAIKQGEVAGKLDQLQLKYSQRDLYSVLYWFGHREGVSSSFFYRGYCGGISS